MADKNLLQLMNEAVEGKYFLDKEGRYYELTSIDIRCGEVIVNYHDGRGNRPDSLHHHIGDTPLSLPEELDRAKNKLVDWLKTK